MASYKNKKKLQYSDKEKCVHLLRLWHGAKHFWKWRATYSGWHQKRGVRWRMQRCNRGGSRWKTLPRGPIRLACTLSNYWYFKEKHDWDRTFEMSWWAKILDLRRVTGNFQKSTVIAFYQMGRELSETGLLYSKNKKIAVFFTCSVMILYLFFVDLSISMGM